MATVLLRVIFLSYLQTALVMYHISSSADNYFLNSNHAQDPEEEDTVSSGPEWMCSRTLGEAPGDIQQWPVLRRLLLSHTCDVWSSETLSTWLGQALCPLQALSSMATLTDSRKGSCLEYSVLCFCSKQQTT